MTMEGAFENVLYVKFFGPFSLTWNGQPIAEAEKPGQESISLLLQLLLYRLNIGVEYTEVARTLFRDVERDSAHQEIQSILAQTRDLFRRAGCPAGDYIRKREGRLYWTNEIPVKSDAAEFNRLYREVLQEQDDKRRMELLLEICYCYTGEFLETQQGLIWVAQEVPRYQARFRQCVTAASEALCEQRDYLRLEELGRYAAQVDPMNGWEELIIEACLAQGRKGEAKQHYVNTVEKYDRVQGVKPSERLVALRNRFEDNFGLMEHIQNDMEQEDKYPEGGFYCSEPVFRNVYQLMRRMMDRSGQPIYLMLCMIVDMDGNPIQDVRLLDAVAPRLKEAIVSTLRIGDVVTRYRQ